MDRAKTARQRVSRLVASVSERVFPPDYLAKRRDIRDWSSWIQGIQPQLLEDMRSGDADAKRRLFAGNVRLVEIETHARCNRICWFCPNAIKDRRRDKTRADPEMLERLLGQLA